MSSSMKDIEDFIKIVQQKRLADQHKLEHLDVDCREKELMKELRDLRNERERVKENITKHLNMIAAHKHSIHKIVHSSKHISGLPVPHNYAQDVKTMFTDGIEFLNNIGDTYKILDDTEENNVDPMKLIVAVTTCTEAVESELYQTRCSIAQLDTLKDNIALLQEHISENGVTIADESTMSFDELTDSGSTIT